jgi:RimJ/RimL family protein N-acetyltransferase
LAESDYDGISRVQARRFPDHPVSAEEFRQQSRIVGATGNFQHRLVVEITGSAELAGWGAIYNQPRTLDLDKYAIEAVVDPAVQRRGVGRYIYDSLEAVARERKAAALWATVRAADEGSVRFLAQCGFLEKRRAWLSRLDLISAAANSLGPPRPVRGPDVVFTTIAEEGPDRREVQDRLYRLESAARLDEPSIGQTTPPSFEEFLESTFRGPGFLPEGIFVARVGDQYVAMTELSRIPNQPDTLFIHFTGTLREYRGKGFASELKRQSTEFAVSRNCRYLETANDSQNAPMWAINQRLGFKIERVYINGEKELKY